MLELTKEEYEMEMSGERSMNKEDYFHIKEIYEREINDQKDILDSYKKGLKEHVEDYGEKYENA